MAPATPGHPDVVACSTDELAAGAAGGSSASFEALVDRLGPRLLRYLRRRVRDEHAAEDVLQETFLKAYRNLGRYDPSRSFATWIFTIATRLAASYLRSRRPAAGVDGLDPPATGVGPAEAASRREQNAGLWALASRVLGDGQFTALWLRYAEDMSLQEVADVMARSKGSVKVLLHRACRRLTDRVARRQTPAADAASAGEALVEA